MQPRIYVYKITFLEVPYYYYGVHKEKVFNEEYFGSSVTHKDYWEKYTPQKEILEVFEFSDNGWIEAQKKEKKYIKPVYNTDVYCLNENCGGVFSLNSCRKVAEMHRQNNTNFYSKEFQKEQGKKAGQKNIKTGHIFRLAKYNMENNLGIFSLSTEEKIKIGKMGGDFCFKNSIGIFARTKEKHKQDSIKGGKSSAQKHKELGIGIFSLTEEELSMASKKANSQRWKCLVTGYITSAGPLSKYQNKRGIDTSLRMRIV